ncbi:MAG: sugar transferase [Pseudomonadota bacterium]
MVDSAQDFLANGEDYPVVCERIHRDSIAKRLFDIVFAGAMLAAFLPIFLIISAAIMMIDGGNPFFAHTRVGRGGKLFRCLKFRTMVRDADKELTKLLVASPEAAREWKACRKLRDDPRILPVIGSLLRKSSLDELPQALNVLRGEMSIVGPRPVVAEELERYGAFERYYLSVRPGLTGPWQVGNRSDESYDNRVRQDVDYVVNRSMSLDLRIVLRTARIFLSGRAPGAY